MAVAAGLHAGHHPDEHVLATPQVGGDAVGPCDLGDAVADQQTHAGGDRSFELRLALVDAMERDLPSRHAAPQAGFELAVRGGEQTDTLAVHEAQQPPRRERLGRIVDLGEGAAEVTTTATHMIAVDHQQRRTEALGEGRRGDAADLQALGAPAGSDRPGIATRAVRARELDRSGLDPLYLGGLGLGVQVVSIGDPGRLIRNALSLLVLIIGGSDVGRGRRGLRGHDETSL